jgi:hypothetical protein
VSKLEALEAELGSAQRKVRYWMFGFAGFLLLAIAADTLLGNGVGSLLAVLAALICWIGGLVSTHLYSKAFHEFWDAAGLTKDQIILKWHELHPGD